MLYLLDKSPIFVGSLNNFMTMTWFSEKIMVYTRCICDFMPNSHKKSWMVSSVSSPQCAAMGELFSCGPGNMKYGFFD